MDLSTPLKRVLGAPRAGPLAATLDLHTVGDLLRHYPRRYAERGRLTGFDELVIGEHATVFAEVELVKFRQIREKLGKTDVTVVDGEGRRMTMVIAPNTVPVRKPPRPVQQVERPDEDEAPLA